MKKWTLLCHELCCTKTIPIIFLKLTIHKQHRSQGRSEQHTGVRIPAFWDLAPSFCEWFPIFQSITAPSSSVSDHLHLNVKVPRSFQTSGATHKTTKSQQVLIFSKTAVRNSNLTINEYYYCYVLTAKQQFTSVTFKQCAGKTENLCFYSRHLTFLLSVTCTNPQISMTQLKHINRLWCHNWQHIVGEGPTRLS